MRVARKFTLGLVAGIVLVHAGSAVVRVRREQALFAQDTARDTLLLARALARAVDETWRTRGEARALEVFQHVAEREEQVKLRWVWVGAARGSTWAPRAATARLEPLERGEPVVLRLGRGSGALCAYVPVRAPNGRLGAIEVVDSLRREQEYVRRSIVNAAASALIMVALCALMSYLLGYVLIGQPVRQLVEQAQAIGGGNLGRRLGVAASDELGALAREMDQMSAHLLLARQQLEQETNTRISAIEQLRHADRLTTVGTLASGVAHELGTPINVVAGYSQLIREDSEASARVKENAQIIARQCQKMTQIIRQLLDFSRRGGQPAARTDARALAQDTLAMVAPLVRKQGVMARLEDASDDTCVDVPYHQLQQALINLVINSLQAMPDGGDLQISVGRARAVHPGKNAPPADHVVLSVKDTGTGMSPEVAERVFEPFFTTKEVGQGTGLGLSVTYGIVEDHGGWVVVQSEVGRGACFTIYLPAVAT